MRRWIDVFAADDDVDAAAAMRSIILWSIGAVIRGQYYAFYDVC